MKVLKRRLDGVIHPYNEFAAKSIGDFDVIEIADPAAEPAPVAVIPAPEPEPKKAAK